MGLYAFFFSFRNDRKKEGKETSDELYLPHQQQEFSHEIPRPDRRKCSGICVSNFPFDEPDVPPYCDGDPDRIQYGIFSVLFSF